MYTFYVYFYVYMSLSMLTIGLPRDWHHFYFILVRDIGSECQGSSQKESNLCESSEEAKWEFAKEAKPKPFYTPWASFELGCRSTTEIKHWTEHNPGRMTSTSHWLLHAWERLVPSFSCVELCPMTWWFQEFTVEERREAKLSRHMRAKIILISITWTILGPWNPERYEGELLLRGKQLNRWQEQSAVNPL